MPTPKPAIRYLLPSGENRPSYWLLATGPLVKRSLSPNLRATMSLPTNVIIFSQKESACERHGYFASPGSETILSTPGFIVYDERFLSILGNNPSIELIAENPTDPFAHEAGVYINGGVFVTSNHMREDGAKHVQISKVSKINESIGQSEPTRARYSYN